MSDYLPDELVFKILERLPVKSLIRSTSVCKSWYSLIKSPSFITLHLNRLNSSPHQIIENEKIVFGASDADGSKIGFYNFYSLSCDNSCYNHLKLDVSGGSALRNVEIVGTCSGLVCVLLVLKNADVDRVVIWNPSIRKTVSILGTQSTIHGQKLYGFCVHPTTYEFKVLALHSQGVEIYRQHTGAWSAIHCVLPYLVLSQASVNGLVYWLRADRDDNHRFRNSIALFNMHTEAFSEVTLPPSLVHAKPGHLRLMFSQESLILYDFSGHSIWVMKEYGVSESWCKLFNVEMPEECLIPFGLRMNGQLLSAAGNSLVCHDPVTNRTTTIAIEGAQIQPTGADTYVESLLLLNANAASEHDSFGEFLSD